MKGAISKHRNPSHHRALEDASNPIPLLYHSYTTPISALDNIWIQCMYMSGCLGCFCWTLLEGGCTHTCEVGSRVKLELDFFGTQKKGALQSTGEALGDANGIHEPSRPRFS